MVQVHGAEEDKRSFEVMTSVVYKPGSVGKVNDKGRGIIYNKNYTASSLDDKQESDGLNSYNKNMRDIWKMMGVEDYFRCVRKCIQPIHIVVEEVSFF